jgi:undecaprenyl-diphosphatase
MFRAEPTSWRFVRNILVAFLPSAILGLAIKDIIDIMLGSPEIVAVALVVGGVAMLIIERLVKPSSTRGVADMPLKQALGVGIVQCLAMIPGVSRSGATIMGALCLGVERRTAAEFSFFLAVPTMVGATSLELFQRRDSLSTVPFDLIGIGFVVSFVVALVVIKWFVGIVSRRGFAPFAWYRIVAGSAALIWLLNR